MVLLDYVIILDSISFFLCFWVLFLLLASASRFVYRYSLMNYITTYEIILNFVLILLISIY